MKRAVLQLQLTMVMAVVGIALHAQPRALKEIPDQSSMFASIGDFAYFVSADSLWRTDGTSGGTIFLKNGFDGFADFTEFDGMLYFLSGRGSDGWGELWRSDGTAAGTVLVEAFPHHGMAIIDPAGSYLYFAATDAATGHELYRTDGTAEGTMLLKDINPGSADGLTIQHLPQLSYYAAAAVGTHLFFEADDGSHGKELWKTDGTPTGTVMVEDINPGAADGMAYSVPISDGSKFYFRGVTSTYGAEPWVSDGTTYGTRILKDIEPGPSDAYTLEFGGVSNGWVYFLRSKESGAGAFTDLWKTNGTPSSTAMVETVCNNTVCRFDSRFLTYNGKLHFFLYRVYGVNELWGTDGTAEGTGRVWEQLLDGGIGYFDVLNDLMIFYTLSQGNSTDLYRSDGTAAGTTSFYSFRSGQSGVVDVVRVGDLAFFADHVGSGTGDERFQLMQTDGMTVLPLRDVFGESYSITRHLLNYRDKLLFTTDDQPGSELSVKLWIYDPLDQGNNSPGKVQAEVWDGIEGRDISLIPVDSPPSSVSNITIFETPQNIGDEYGTRVRGYIIAPTTGGYTFWISSDDRGELWLSSDDHQANKMKIASVPGWTNYRQWNKYPDQRSATVNLVAGEKYYIEALMKEIRGADHLAVGWQLPDGTVERPIPGNRLLSFNHAPVVTITSPEDDQSFAAPVDVMIAAAALDSDGTIAKVEFYHQETKLGEDFTSPYSFTWGDVAPGNYSLIAKAIDNSGDASADTVRITVSGEACASTGMIQVETWTGISGWDISSIPLGSPPSSVTDVTSFETTQNIGDNYGSRVRGYLCIPTTGDYTFWIASDDRSELWLSTDENPANKRKIAYVEGWTAFRQWDRYATQRSVAISLVAGQHYYVEALIKEGTGADHLSVGWQLPGGTLERPIAGNRLIPFSPAPEGMVEAEVWTGIPGRNISSIPLDSPPSSVTDITMFETAQNIGDDYGSRVRGYIHVPTTGNYTFWIATDDSGELWLSTDENPDNKVRVAYVSGWTYSRQWNKYTTQTSSPVHLVAGRKYYIEALLKEGTGLDHLAVGWQLPGGGLERPIPGSRLSKFEEQPETSEAASDTNLYSSINLFPNPADSGSPGLSVGGYERISETIETQIEIINMAGEVVFADEVSCGGGCGSYPLKVDKQLVPGLYLVNLNTGGVRSSKRLLVK